MSQMKYVLVIALALMSLSTWAQENQGFADDYQPEIRGPYDQNGNPPTEDEPPYYGPDSAINQTGLWLTPAQVREREQALKAERTGGDRYPAERTPGCGFTDCDPTDRDDKK